MEYIQLNPFDTEPLYRQLKNSIKKAILDKKLKHQDLLPSENTLITLFDISATVVKAAYQALEDERLIVRIRGKGTFVDFPENIVINLPFYFSLNQHIQFNHINLTANYLPTSDPMKSQMPSAKTITKIRRLVYMNQVLTTYQEIYLPNQKRSTILNYLTNQKDIKDILLELTMQPDQAQWINKHGMKKASDIEASFLKVVPGHPLHKIASEVKDKNQLTLAIAYTAIRGDIVSIRYDKRI
jgi:DNA-binding GntR family transcriptional regulator